MQRTIPLVIAFALHLAASTPAVPGPALVDRVLPVGDGGDAGIPGRARGVDARIVAPASGQTRVTLRLHPAEQRSHDGLAGLRRELRAALIEEGLFEDEAEAMLETWRLSYFDSEGLRLFYLLPREWTDRRLPLSFSVPARTVRVMLGRIELISPMQRVALQRLLELPDFRDG